MSEKWGSGSPDSPGRHRVKWDERGCGLGCLALLLGFTWMTGSLAWPCLYPKFTVAGAMAGLVSVASLAFLVVTVIVGLRVKVFVVPYFDRPVGHTGTFCRGAGLARNRHKLDRIAEVMDLPTISSFGFADDRLGEEVVWHDPRTALPTIDGLIRTVEENSGAVDDAAEVLLDLRPIRKALAMAAEKGVRFCFVFWVGNVVIPQEMCLRKGVFS